MLKRSPSRRVRHAPVFFGVALTILFGVSPRDSLAAEKPSDRPAMRDFIGLNVHTVQFKPDLYGPTCRLLRDYHPVGWDLGDDTARPTSFPMAANGVDWGKLYAGWTKAGFAVDACLMFDDLPHDKWKDPAKDARAYGEAFARSFGPSSKKPLVTSAEIGNEPAKYSEQEYRVLFENLARGLRAGDPKLHIATCAVMTGKPDQWSKPMSAVAGLETLYDVVNVHTYPFKEQWPTWRRSYPEDPSIRFLKDIDDLQKWRNEHANGKPIWVTEFGYDSTTKTPAAGSGFEKWVGVSDAEQARYIVRSFLVLSATGVDRAYLYFFNDKDEPQLHGASGITRDFKPKPSFYAMSHLYAALGEYCFVRAIQRKDGDAYCFDYQHITRPAEHVYVAWIAGEKPDAVRRQLPIGTAQGKGVYRAERMPLEAGNAPKSEWKVTPTGVDVELTGDPVFLWSR